MYIEVNILAEGKADSVKKEKNWAKKRNKEYWHLEAKKEEKQLTGCLLLSLLLHHFDFTAKIRAI